MKARELLQYRKDPRFIITIPLLLIVAISLVYYFIQRAKELSPEALSSRLLLFVLWNINLLLILGILFVLLRVVVKLVIERQKGILGSRFRTKLVTTYVATSLVPIVLLFLVATDLLRVSIDRWFNTPVRTLLQNSEKIAEEAQQRALRQAGKAAEEIAAELREGPMIGLDTVLNHVRQHHDVDVVGAYQDGIVLKLLANPRSPIHEVSEPPSRFFEEVARAGTATKIDLGAHGKWLRTGVRVGGQGPPMAAIAGVFIPSSVSRMIDENIIAYQNFQQLESQRQALKTSQTSLFLNVTLYILFGALWTAIFVSRRITVPIQALAEGTRNLAEGDYAHRIEVKATDEFGSLIGSFNAMADQLQTQRGALTQSNDELQIVNQRLGEERAYLSTVLESVATGIIAISDALELLSVNRAAVAILQLDREPAGTVDQAFQGDLAVLADHLLHLEKDSRPREITLFRGGELHYLEVSAARLEGGTGAGGWVIAIEDSTQLVRAQKLAAWSEAARRIAHEIKNPLTPIQLSAERIAKKSKAGDADLAHAVEEGCRTIVAEVGQLKRMVDEFSRFARMPAIHLRQADISEILQQIAKLYDEVKPNVRVRVSADEALRAVVDPEQIRRALINLVDNAIEATDRGEIVLTARRKATVICLQVIDPGRGVPDADKEKLFLPYFSTKGRGTGLGLAIVHRIVNDHDGRISVYDNPPRGTRFEIELPA